MKDIKTYREMMYDLCKIDSEVNRDRKALERAKNLETEAAFDEVIVKYRNYFTIAQITFVFPKK